MLKEELNPIIIEKLEENNIGDNVALFYFASIIKETVNSMDNKNIKEAIIRFILDSDRNEKI